MPKVSEEYRTSKREEIADAALRAFSRKGFQGASMADIMSESGLSAGAIYGHFKGKSDIVVAVATRLIGNRVIDVEHLAGLTPMPSPGEVVGVLMRAMARDIEKPGALVQIWGECVTDPVIRGLSAAVFEQLRATYTAYISLWQQRRNGMLPADADALARVQAPLFLAACQGFIAQRAMLDDFDPEKYLSSVAECLPR